MRGIRTQINRTQSHLKETSHPIIVVGATDIGIQLAETLGGLGQNVVLIDEQEEFLRELYEEVDVLSLTGNPLALETLKTAGAGKGTRLLAVTHSDEVNLLLLFLGSSLGIKEGFALVQSEETYESFLPVISRSGGHLHMILLPELVTRSIEKRGYLQIRNLYTDRERGIRLIAVEFFAKHPFVGETISQLRLGGRNKPLCVFKQEEILPVESHFRIEAHDIILVQIDLLDQERMMRNWLTYDSMSKVMLGGSDFLPTFLAHWPNFSRGLICIEKDLANCQQMLKVGDRALVLRGDGLDISLLQEARIDEAKFFLAVSDHDEVNLLASLLAKSFGVKNVLTILHKRQHTGMLERLSLDGIISIPQLVVDNLLVWLMPSSKNPCLGRLKVRWTPEFLPATAQLVFRGGTLLLAREQKLREGEDLLTIC